MALDVRLECTHHITRDIVTSVQCNPAARPVLCVMVACSATSRRPLQDVSLLGQDYTRKLKRQLYYFQRKQRFMQLIWGQTARHHVMQLARDREAQQVQVRNPVLQHLPEGGMLRWRGTLSCRSSGQGGAER